MIESSQAGIEGGSEPLEASARFPNKAGLHARSAAVLIRTVARYTASLTLELNGRTAGAASLMELLKLGARQGDAVRIVATGPEAEGALQEIVHLIESGFNEE
jgi:PTS hybrid protein